MQFEYQSRAFDIQGVSSEDHIYRRIVKSKTFYEIDLLEYILELKPILCSTKHQNVAVDVGANIGNHSLFFSCFLVDHLISIEPNPKVLAALRRNLDVNATDFSLYECGVGAKQGKGNIVLPEKIKMNIGASKLVASIEGDIEVSTLDSIISKWSKGRKKRFKISFIKIDVEGMELEVLKGAKYTLMTHKPHIFAEASTDSELDTLCDFLSKMGYKKLPGKWAKTPVYHFAPSASLRLMIKLFLIRFINF